MANKYKAKRTVVNGVSFQSKKEARRWNTLLLLQEAGEIMNLQRQVKYVLIPTQRIDGKVVERECSYVADFVYSDRISGETVVEDTKGIKTRDYIIKRKLMLHKYGIRIKEV